MALLLRHLVDRITFSFGSWVGRDRWARRDVIRLTCAEAGGPAVRPYPPLQKISCYSLLILAACTACWLPLHGQTAPSAGQPPATFRTLSIDQGVSDLFYDDRSRQIALAAGDMSFSQPYPVPASGLVSLYRELPPVPPEDKPRRVPVTEFRLTGEGPHLVFFSSTRNAANPAQPLIGAIPVDDSSKIHPVDTVRIFNFGKTPAGVKFATHVLEIAPSKSEIRPYPDDRQAWLKAAVPAEGKWQVRISGPQAIVPATRSTWVLLDLPPTADEPDRHRILVRNLIDFTPPPEAKP